MKRSVFSVSTIVFLTFAGAAVQAEEVVNPPPAAAPVVAPKPPAPVVVPAAAPKPVVVPKPVPAEKEQKPAAVPPPASPPANIPEPMHSGDMPVARETKAASTGYAWPAFSFAMLIVGFVAGYFWRHHVSRHKLGGMTVRIGTWRGTP